jgi:hypothetical protein
LEATNRRAFEGLLRVINWPTVVAELVEHLSTVHEIIGLNLVAARYWKRLPEN